MAVCVLLVLSAWWNSTWADAERATNRTDRIHLRDEVQVHEVWPAVAILHDSSRVMSVNDAMARLSDFAVPPRSTGARLTPSTAALLFPPAASLPAALLFPPSRRRPGDRLPCSRALSSLPLLYVNLLILSVSLFDKLQIYT
jgi:hypothetical protein